MAVDQARFPLVLDEEISEINTSETPASKISLEQPKHGWQHGQNGVKPET